MQQPPSGMAVCAAKWQQMAEAQVIDKQLAATGRMSHAAVRKRRQQLAGCSVQLYEQYQQMARAQVIDKQLAARGCVTCCHETCVGCIWPDEACCHMSDGCKRQKRKRPFGKLFIRADGMAVPKG